MIWQVGQRTFILSSSWLCPVALLSYVRHISGVYWSFWTHRFYTLEVFHFYHIARYYGSLKTLRFDAISKKGHEKSVFWAHRSLHKACFYSEDFGLEFYWVPIRILKAFPNLFLKRFWEHFSEYFEIKYMDSLTENKKGFEPFELIIRKMHGF